MSVEKSPLVAHVLTLASCCAGPHLPHWYQERFGGGPRSVGCGAHCEGQELVRAIIRVLGTCARLVDNVLKRVFVYLLVFSNAAGLVFVCAGPTCVVRVSSLSFKNPLAPCLIHCSCSCAVHAIIHMDFICYCLLVSRCVSLPRRWRCLANHAALSWRRRWLVAGSCVHVCSCAIHAVQEWRKCKAYF